MHLAWFQPRRNPQWSRWRIAPDQKQANYHQLEFVAQAEARSLNVSPELPKIRQRTPDGETGSCRFPMDGSVMAVRYENGGLRYAAVHDNRSGRQVTSTPGTTDFLLVLLCAPLRRARRSYIIAAII